MAEPETFPPDSIPKDGNDQLDGTWARLKVPEAEMKLRVGIVVAMRAQGCSHKEISEASGLSLKQIRYAMQHAHEARLAVASIQHRLDNVAVPLAVENLIAVLEDETHDRHYDAIRDTLYGRGEFRNHSHSVSDNRNTNLNLTVEYEMPGGARVPDVVQLTEASGLMVGKPRDDGDDPARD